MPRLVYIVTFPITLSTIMTGQLAYMRERGFEVIAVASPGDHLATVAEREGVSVVSIPIQREIHPVQDVVSFVRLYRLLRRLRPAIVNAGTPKAGLLGMLAARLARVPVRIYTLHGLRLETTRGFKRLLLSLCEVLSSGNARRVFCVSESLRSTYLRAGLSPAFKAVVLGKGSANGIDFHRFQRTPERASEGMSLRKLLGIPLEVPVVGFIGRLTRDKGIVELIEAFEQLLITFPDARLLLLGDFEPDDPVPKTCVLRLMTHPHVIICGFAKPEPYYAAMDVLAFPSYREGLPTVVLEAAAAGLPAVAFRATGSVDAVQDGVTGTIVPLGDVPAFAAALRNYLERPELRRKHGEAGCARAQRDFRQDVVWEAVYDQYVNLLEEKSLPPPKGSAESILLKEGVVDE